MTKDDPYNDIKIYHKAELIAPGGGVSPLCAEKPRKLNLKKELWTLDDASVTCEKCKKKLRAKASSWKGVFEKTSYSSGPEDNIYVFG